MYSEQNEVKDCVQECLGGAADTYINVPSAENSVMKESDGTSAEIMRHSGWVLSPSDGRIRDIMIGS